MEESHKPRLIGEILHQYLSETEDDIAINIRNECNERGTDLNTMLGKPQMHLCHIENSPIKISPAWGFFI